VPTGASLLQLSPLGVALNAPIVGRLCAAIMATANARKVRVVQMTSTVSADGGRRAMQRVECSAS
jgi:uncharacterized membrane protein